MQTNPQPRSVGWKTIAAALGAGTLVVLLSVTMLGTQVSGILSTVGSSVGGPYGGQGDVGGDGGGDGSGAGSDGSGSGDADGGSSGAGAGSGGGSGSGIVLAVPRDDLLVIKTGRISMQVTDVAPAISAATDAITRVGGYASGSKRSGAGRDVQATVTFRVPSGQWEAALAAVRQTGEVLDEETATEDVTTKVVDLGARIRNLQVTERALQSIMDKATVVKDVLSVQQQLTDTRGEIERLMAEKAHLEEQAAFSTLTATFALAPEPAVVIAQTSGFDPAEEADAATAQLIRGLQKVMRAGIWFGIVWLPILLALATGSAVAFVVGRRIAHRLSRPTIEFVEVGGSTRE